MKENQEFLDRIAPLAQNIHYFVKWTIISVTIGTVVGLISTLFGHGVLWASETFGKYPWVFYLAPAAGLLIVLLYAVFHEEKNRGTNMVLAAISSDEKITSATAPLIFVSGILSQAVGASVGREGAALQLGGSLGNLLGDLIWLDEKDKKVAVMCGMSAGFAALFGTPLAAGVFAMEVVSIGVMYYAALVPCLFASFFGAGIAGGLGLHAEHFSIGAVPAFTGSGALLAIVLGILCACLGILLCQVFHRSGALYQKYLPNPYLRVLAGSVLLIGLTLVFSDRIYNGSGIGLIERCFAGEAVPWYAFAMKLLFTAVALGAGFKGGEIVPTLSVGAAFGLWMASLLGAPAGLCTAICMVALFGGVTNCPVSTLLLSFELFGYDGMPYYAIAIAVSFTLSGYYGLYSSQKFIYSKTKAEYINRKSH